MYNYNFYIVIMDNCDTTELYKLVWQFPYPMVTPVIGYKENKEIDWLIDWLIYVYKHSWLNYIYIFKCLELCTLCNTRKACASPGIIQHVCNAVVHNIVVLLLFLQSIRSRMQRVCKCHGMSGSCSIRVCWRKLPPFRQVGDILSARYEGASHVKMVDKKRRRIKKLRAVSRDYKQPNKTDLVFLEESPDYCERNETWVWFFFPSAKEYESHFCQGVFWLIE